MRIREVQKHMDPTDPDPDEDPDPQHWRRPAFLHERNVKDQSREMLV
jgi:hypothetical protein